MRTLRLVSVVSLICIFTQCSEPEVSVATETKLLSDEQVKSMGFNTNWFGAIEQEEWHKDRFGTAVIHAQSVKSIKPMRDSPSMFPRFGVARERYPDPGMASKRHKHLDETDPSGFDKSIYKGLIVDSDVWIVRADAHIFGYRELDNFITKLRAIVAATEGQEATASKTDPEDSQKPTSGSKLQPK